MRASNDDIREETNMKKAFGILATKPKLRMLAAVAVVLFAGYSFYTLGENVGEFLYVLSH